jgi:hypothetical protein
VSHTRIAASVRIAAALAFAALFWVGMVNLFVMFQHEPADNGSFLFVEYIVPFLAQLLVWQCVAVLYRDCRRYL